MAHCTKIENFYVEYPALTVEYEILPATYGRAELDGTQGYMAGVPRLPEQIDITHVYVQIDKYRQIDILNSLPEEYVINLEDEIQASLHD